MQEIKIQEIKNQEIKIKIRRNSAVLSDGPTARPTLRETSPNPEITNPNPNPIFRLVAGGVTGNLACPV